MAEGDRGNLGIGRIALAETRCFAQGRRAERKVDDVLRTLTLLGQAERADGGYILSH